MVTRKSDSNLNDDCNVEVPLQNSEKLTQDVHEDTYNIEPENIGDENAGGASTYL